MLRDWYMSQLSSDLPNTAGSVPNPFEEPVSGMFPFIFPHLFLTLTLFLATTLQDVQLELMKEDAAEGAKSPHKVSLTSFLVIGMDLEDQQCVI